MMTNKFLTIFFLFISSVIYAQTKNGTKDNNDHSNDDHVLTYVEEMPEFPGGAAALNKFLAENITYPSLAIDSGIQGKVIVDFVVRKDGKVTDVLLAKGIGFGCDEEALRVVKAMPLWKPGKQNGKFVSVSYRVPIKFTLH